MSRETGRHLPDDLVRFFAVDPSHEEFRQVIPVTTVDADGWPRHAMLSRWEVVARSEDVLLMLLRSRRSASNVRRTGRVTLTVVSPSMSYYIFCLAKTRASIDEAPDADLFELAVTRVVEDVLPTARIVSAMTFEGHDAAVDEERRAHTYRKLISTEIRPER